MGEVRQDQRQGDKKRQLASNKLEGFKKIIFNYGELGETIYFGIENAINQCKVQ